jgi:squalene cyclase
VVLSTSYPGLHYGPKNQHRGFKVSVTVEVFSDLGVEWLLERQNEAGSWDELEFTGTGFPNHFYLRYDMYAHYFPLMALGRLQRRLAAGATS